MSGTQAPPLTLNQSASILGSVIANLSIIRTSPAWTAPGVPVTASLVALDPLIDVSDLASGVLNVAATVKDVIFADPAPVSVPEEGSVSGTGVLIGLANQNQNPVVGGEPFPPPLGSITTSSAPIPKDIAGLLGQIFGTVSIPRLRIWTRIRWIVRNADGTDEQEGEDFLSVNGISNPSVTFLLPPVFEELRADTLMQPQLDGRCLTAEVTLTLGPWMGTATLPPISIYMLPLLIPTCVALFEEANFGTSWGGGALVIVPLHSPIGSVDSLVKALQAVYHVLDALSGLSSIAFWLLGLGDLLDALPKQPRVQLAQRNEIGDFEPYQIRSHPPLPDFISDDWDDATRSLIMVGVSGTRGQFYNDDHFHTSGDLGVQGYYDLIVPAASVSLTPNASTTRGLWVMIPDLGGIDASTTYPNTVPGGCLVAGHLDEYGSDNTWNASISSVRFESNWLDGVATQVNAVNPQVDPNLPNLQLPALQSPALPQLACSKQPLQVGPIVSVPVPPLKPGRKPPPTPESPPVTIASEARLGRRR